ncbi:LysR substrate-binding domain-containing protein [Robbsia sp. KACC 23696]|uniref:LysR substrate-binding domain-containing protein n=1 Tax=Robbsia sp. KACC 23696 TaxID=3149231 RepID=UPI00325A765B
MTTLNRIKLRHLQCFLAVLQQGSLQKAADALSISQPAASKTLSELEGALNVVLFVRGRNGATPTASAMAFQRHAAACMISLQDGIDAAIHATDVGPERLRIGVLPTLVSDWVTLAIKRFGDAWPHVTLQLTTGTNRALLNGMRDAELDMALGRIADPAAMSGLNFEFLRSEPLSACVAPKHPLLSERRIGATQLLAYPLILPPAGTLIRESANRILATLEDGGARTAAPRIETVSVSMGRQLVREHDFVWFVPHSAIRLDVESGLLQTLPISTAGSEEPVGMILPVDRQTPVALHGWLACLREAAKLG